MTIRIAFRFQDPRLFARLVCFVQRHDSAHCEVAWSWADQQHECVSASFVDHGVRAKSIAMPPEKWRIYELPLPYRRVLDWFDAHKDEGYDWLGLLGFIVRRVKGWLRRKFCSEAGADIMGLPDPWRYDLALLESVCARFGRRVQ